MLAFPMFWWWRRKEERRVGDEDMHPTAAELGYCCSTQNILYHLSSSRRFILISISSTSLEANRPKEL